MNKDKQTIAHALVDYRWQVDSLKQIQSSLCKVAVQGIDLKNQIHTLASIIERAESALNSSAAVKIIDEYLQSPSGEVIVDNNALEPVSIYRDDELVGVARNSEALLSVLRQVKAKKLTGYSMQFRGERIDVDSKGKLDHMPSIGTLFLTPEIQKIFKAVSQDAKREKYRIRNRK